MRVHLQSSYVLHSRPYRETSLLVDAFTFDYGQIGLVARGARARRSRLRGLLQPFRPLLLSWSGRGELFTLVGAEANGRAPRLAGATLMSGFYLNELLKRLTARHDPLSALFQVYHKTLLALEIPSEHERALRIFEKCLLEELGYGLLLEREGAGVPPTEEGNPVEANCEYAYEFERGPVPMAHGRADAVRIRGKSLLSLARHELRDAKSLQDAKRLMRAALARYLGDKPLKSREVLRKLQVIGTHDVEHLLI
jgi:DNA repair protein RecO